MNTTPIRSGAGLACALALILAGCASEPSSEEEAAAAAVAGDENALSSRSLKIAETAWLSVSADGEVFTTFLDPDGRYRDVSAGAVRFSGSWEQTEGGELCFSPDQESAKVKRECWEHGAPGLGGVMRATNAAGRAIEVKQVAYTPPPKLEERPADESASQPDPETVAENRG